MYSFKHALTQDVVYASLLERRRRGTTPRPGAASRSSTPGGSTRWSSSSPTTSARAPKTTRPSTTRSSRRRRHSGAGPTRRRWPYFEAPSSASTSMPDTAANRLRRIDAVVKQAEVKFALGRHAEHVEALEGIKDLVDAVADPPRRATWYYWTGFLLEPRRRPAREVRSRTAARLSRSPTPAASTTSGHSPSAVSPTSTSRGRPPGRPRDRRARPRDLRGARQPRWACRALWALSPAAQLLGEWERGLGYCRRALDHGQSVNDLRLKVVGWWRTGSDPHPPG